MVALKLSEMRVGKCCCFNLRTGSMIIAIIYLVCSIIAFIGLSLLSWAVIDDEKPVKNVLSKDSKEYIDYRTYLYGTTVLTFFVIIMSGMLIQGIRTRKSHLMFPLICMSFMGVLYALATSVGNCVYEIAAGTLAGFIGHLIVLPISFGINCYFYLVLYTMYCEIKEGTNRGTMTV